MHEFGAGATGVWKIREKEREREREREGGERDV